MKINFSNGVFSAVAESMDDVQVLLSLVQEKKPRGVAQVKRPASYRKECGLCGKKFKRLGVHKALAHEGKGRWHSAEAVAPETW